MALVGKSLKLNPAKYVITGAVTSVELNTKNVILLVVISRNLFQF
jgi:curli biogenesis system outer membrane secretion channel CsgG